MKLWSIHRNSFKWYVGCSNFGWGFHRWHNSTSAPISEFKVILSVKKWWGVNCKRFLLEKLRKTFHWSLVFLTLSVIDFFEFILNYFKKYLISCCEWEFRLWKIFASIKKTFFHVNWRVVGFVLFPFGEFSLIKTWDHSSWEFQWVIIRFMKIFCLD